MPYTVNGVGTTYYGKKNVDEHIGVCESCNQRAVLLDYDTRHWFVILFIPIIPLGRKRIINYCSVCSRHRSVSLHEWEEGTQAAMQEGMEALRSNPDSQEAMVQAHATFAQTGKREEALKLATLMREKFPDDVDIHLYLVGWYESVGMNEDVDACLEHAYEVDPENPFASRGMALVYLDHNQPDKARELLEKYKPGSEYYDAAAYVQLANSYQSQGDHESAAEIHKMILEANPEVGKSKEFRSSVRKTSQALGTPIPEMETPPIYKHPFVKIAAIFLLAFFAFCCWTLYLAGHRKVYVVNGLNSTIKVQFDDRTQLEVLPLSQVTTTLPEGVHEVELLSPQNAKTQKYHFSLTGEFVTRPFDKTVTVLDPSRSAVVALVYDYYAEDPENNPRLQRQMIKDQFHVCKAVIQFPSIDYPFQDTPQEVRIPDSEDIVKKSKLELLAFPHEELFGISFRMNNDKKTYQYCKRHLEIEPGNIDLMNYMARSATTDQEKAFSQNLLKEKLKQTPDDETLHYSLLYSDGPATSRQDLMEFYDELIKAHPDNVIPHFMKGKLFSSIAEAIAHWNETLKIDPNFLGTHSELAHLYFTVRDFEAALPHVTQVMNDKNKEEEEDIIDSEWMNLVCCIMLDREEELLAYHAENPEMFSRLFQQWFISQDKISEADQITKTLFDKYKERVEKSENSQQITPESIQKTGYYFEFPLHYFKGEYSEALELLQEDKMDNLSSLSGIELLLLSGDTQEALAQYPYLNEGSRITADIMLSLAHLMEGEHNKAEERLKNVYQKLESGDLSDQRMARLLKEGSANPEEELDQNYWGSNRLLLLSVAALKYDSVREPFTDYLQKSIFTNYSQEMFLKKIISHLTSTAEAEPAQQEGE